MKKLFVCCALAVMLAFGAGSATAQVNPVDQLTGAVWMNSSTEAKNALIFGVECAITVEYYVAQKMMEQESKKSKSKSITISNLSPFEKGWINAFEGVPREQIVALVDAWYKAHPDQLERPVFSVLWNEMIKPKIK